MRVEAERVGGIEPVGNYALSINWSAGHATGIYRFDFLRQLEGADGATIDAPE